MTVGVNLNKHHPTVFLQGTAPDEGKTVNTVLAQAQNVVDCADVGVTQIVDYG